MVGANTFRNPGLTAKLATTLDHVSGRTCGPGHRRRVVRARARGLRHRIREEPGRATGLARRVGDAHPPPARRRTRRSRRPALSDAGRVVRAATDPAAPADPHRRRRTNEDAANRRPAGRRLEQQRVARRDPRRARNARAPLRRGRPRHRHDRTDGELPHHPARRRRCGQGADRGAAGPQRRRRWTGSARPWPGSPAEVADILRPYRDLGFSTFIVRMPAPYDRETIERMPEVGALLDG